MSTRITTVIRRALPLLCAGAILAGCSESKTPPAEATPEGAPQISAEGQQRMNAAQQADAARRASQSSGR